MAPQCHVGTIESPNTVEAFRFCKRNTCCWRQTRDTDMSFNIQTVHKSTSRIRKFVRKNPRKPGPNAVHNLRTSTRSIATVLVTLGLDSRRRVRRLLRDLSDVRKRAGKVRDMDVLTSDALSLKPHGD